MVDTWDVRKSSRRSAGGHSIANLRAVPVAPLDREARENLSTQVERHIRDALLAGRFSPGDRISLISLAETLGTSVTPVREALSRLAAENAFELAPGQIARVPDFNAKKYAELRDIRVVVEGLAAERAALRITKRELAKIGRVLDAFTAASNAEDVQGMLQGSRDFRFLIYDAAKMPSLLRVIEGLWLQNAPSFRRMYAPRTRDERLELVYARLFQALVDHNPVEAREAVGEAVTMGAARLIAVHGG